MGAMDEMSDIQRYFADKSVLVTGATGFLGKVLVERILRTCDVKTLYLTVRPKKNKGAQQRVKEYFDNPVFEKLRDEKDDFLRKVKVVVADFQLPNLGMGQHDREMLKEEIDVVLLTAATTRFDESLKIAVHTNLRSTKDMLKLCMESKHLLSVVYVSTAYANCIEPELQEKFYKPPVQNTELLTMVDALNDETLDVCGSAILKSWPNNYVFTKLVAEECIKTMGNKLPISIVRPSIITSTLRDPVPGWNDSYLGATGIFVGVSLGVIRTHHCNFDKVSDIVPVDYVANCILAAAAQNRVQTNDVQSSYRKISNCDDIPIYNCVTSNRNPTTWRDCFKYGIHYAGQFPVSSQLWHVVFLPTSSKHLFLVLNFLLHTVPAYIVDFFAVLFGKKPEFVKGSQKIGKLLNVLSYFSIRDWSFHDTNTRKLWNGLNKTDQSLYLFDVDMIDWNSYFKDFAIGGRKYLIKENINTIPEAKAKRLKLAIVHYSLIVFLSLILFQVVSWTCSSIYNTVLKT
ncbi:hypothetical protein FQA39_LY14258 [Lamprigera yunnana]|nr:hypothetical protein FQA39_LY14258 [Lamprigera yunnana]